VQDILSGLYQRIVVARMLLVTFERVTAFDMAALPRDESKEFVTRLGGCSFEPVVMPDGRLEPWEDEKGFQVN
jgi:hypothetical protein